MHEEAPQGRKQGTVAVLALLLSVLFSAVHFPASGAGADGRSSAIGQSDKAKSGAPVRTAGRNHSAEDPDESDFGPVAARPTPATLAAASHPGGGLNAFAPSLPLSRASSAYRARAPPAAA